MAETQPTIREARPEDAAAIAKLFESLDLPLGEAEAAERLRRGTETVFLAATGDRAVGLLAMSRLLLFGRALPIARITALAVRAERGDARARELLMERAVAWARREGCEGIEVTSAVRRDHAGAHEFYEESGFRRTDYRYWLRLPG